MKKELFKNTGQIISIILFILYYLLDIETTYSSYIFFFALSSLIASNIYPELFTLIYKILMKASFVINKVTQPVMLFCIYYFLFFPLGVIIKIFEKRDLYYSFKNKRTTWYKTPKLNKKNMIYQF